MDPSLISLAQSLASKAAVVRYTNSALDASEKGRPLVFVEHPRLNQLGTVRCPSTARKPSPQRKYRWFRRH